MEGRRTVSQQAQGEARVHKESRFYRKERSSFFFPEGGNQEK